MTSKLLCAGVILVCLGAWLGPDNSSAVRAVAGVLKSKATYFGNQSCTECHNYKETPKDENKPVDFSSRTEMHRWQTQDKHKDAMEVLLKDLGPRIAQKLGITGKLDFGAKRNKQWD